MISLSGALLSALRSRVSFTKRRQRAKHRQDLWALYSADDRVLKDVGVTRDEVWIRIRRS